MGDSFAAKGLAAGGGEAVFAGGGGVSALVSAFSVGVAAFLAFSSSADFSFKAAIFSAIEDEEEDEVLDFAGAAAAVFLAISASTDFCFMAAILGERRTGWV
jgi:hypothetical protein